jgi:hypothetical protein
VRLDPGYFQVSSVGGRALTHEADEVGQRLVVGASLTLCQLNGSPVKLARHQAATVGRNTQIAQGLL